MITPMNNNAERTKITSWSFPLEYFEDNNTDKKAKKKMEKKPKKAKNTRKSNSPSRLLKKPPIASKPLKRPPRTIEARITI